MRLNGRNRTKPEGWLAVVWRSRWKDVARYALIIAMLAATSIGAVWSSCSPDFGVKGVLDRFERIEPKVLFATDGYFYGGRWFGSCEKAAGIVDALRTRPKTVIVPYRADVDSTHDAASVVPGAVTYDAFIGPQLWMQQLDREQTRHPIHDLAARSVHRTHAAHADGDQQLVFADGRRRRRKRGHAKMLPRKLDATKTARVCLTCDTQLVHR